MPAVIRCIKYIWSQGKIIYGHLAMEMRNAGKKAVKWFSGSWIAKQVYIKKQLAYVYQKDYCITERYSLWESGAISWADCHQGNPAWNTKYWKCFKTIFPQFIDPNVGNKQTVLVM